MMQHLQLINCLSYCVGTWTWVNTCNNDEKFIINYGLCNSKLASMISKVIINEPQEYKLKERRCSHNKTFIFEMNTKTKYFEIVGKSVWKTNKKMDWQKYKELIQHKIQNYD